MKKSITSTYACLSCRKSFKKYRFNQMRDGDWKPIDYKVICPQCGGEVYDAGPAFKTPRKSDRKAWSRLKPLFEGSYRFNPGFGNPFVDRPIYKASQLPIVRKSEFSKVARKRNRFIGK